MIKQQLSPMVIAHRGASAYVRENTIAAFQKAIELNADAIEFDVRKTKDDVFVVYHDENIQGQLLSQLTYAELNDIARQHHFEIPTVEDVLKLTQNRIKLFIELKEEGYEAEIVRLMLKYFSPRQAVMISFQAASLRRIKTYNPQIEVGWLLYGYLPQSIGEFDFIDIHWQLVNTELIHHVQREQIPLFVWTVNNKEMINTFLNIPQIKGITTDYPDFLNPRGVPASVL